MERDERLLDLLHSVVRGLVHQMRSVVRTKGVPGSFMPIMRSAILEPGITITELSRRSGMAKSHVSTAVEEISRRGLIERRGDDHDRRLQHLYPTVQGRELFDQVHKEARDRQREVLSALSDEQIRSLIGELELIQRGLHPSPEDIDGPGPPCSP